ncbi:MAG: ATP-grasp domain-containing protein [Caldilineaceae bacterium]|nr:ATP-grasp domain-containing protein [Caldilineaceae bacterium]
MKQSQPTILVTDTGRGSAISIIRSLGRRGWRVIAADADPNSLGFRSRYVHGTVVYPKPESAPQALVAALEAAVDKWQVDLLIPVTDAIILPLSEARDRFVGRCQVAIPTASALAVATNKLKTVTLAQELGVPTPATRLVHTVAEALEQSRAFDWPLVLKPQVSRLYREHTIEAFEVSYAQTPADLAKQMARFENLCPVLLQEYYPGDGHGVELLMHEGQPLAAFQHKRLREVPLNGGASALRESVALDPELYDHSVRLLQALQWTGLAMVEFKVGNKGPRLMEINGRVWGSLPLAVRSGMDFPARLAELYLQGPPASTAKPAQEYHVGTRARNLELDVLWIAAVLKGKQRYSFLSIPKRSQAIKAILELFHPTYKFDILSWEDPWPGVAELSKVSRKLVSKFKDGA